MLYEMLEDTVLLMLVRFIQEDETTYSVWLQDWSLTWDKRCLGDIQKFW